MDWIYIAYALAILGLYVIKAYVIILPVPMLYVAAGVTFPIIWAVAITYLGLFISFGIGYCNGKKLGEKRAGELLAKHKKAARFMEARKENMPHLCFFTRITPLPKDLFSMFFGAAGMPFAQYMTLSLMGVSPVMISTVLAGSSALDPLSLSFLVPLGIIMAMMVIMLTVSKEKLIKSKL